MISKNRIKYIHSLELKKHRKEEGVFVAEGHKLVGDLIGVFECVYLAATNDWISAHAAEIERLTESNRQSMIDEVTDDELRRISFQEHPQQVLAIFRQPEYDVDPTEAVANGLCLALDDVQNPGNLGTIVRLADWFGIEHIFCSPGCADIFNPKTVQSTMGGLAHVELHYCQLPELLASLPSATPVYGTFLDGENMYEKQLTTNGLIIMGNEGKGVSPEVGKYVTERLYIPNYPQGRETSESLNVAIATAIVCAEFRRR